MVTKADIIVFGRVISSRKKIKYRICRVCGKIFLLVTKNRQYCSRVCYGQARTILRKGETDKFVPFQEISLSSSERLSPASFALRKK